MVIVWSKFYFLVVEACKPDNWSAWQQLSKQKKPKAGKELTRVSYIPPNLVSEPETT
jgi:hypothetical protein